MRKRHMQICATLRQLFCSCRVHLECPLAAVNINKSKLTTRKNMHLKIQIHLKSRKWASAIYLVLSLLLARALANESRKCVPVLNFARPVGAAQSSLDNKSSGMPDRFTFNIGDIDMPLSQTGSSMHAAMKLLAAFDSQLYGLGGGSDYDYDQTKSTTTTPPPRENTITFARNKLHISGLNLTMLNVHLYGREEPKFALGLQIGNTTLEGQFQYSGLAPSALLGVGELYSQLAGHYRMSIDNVLVTASSNLTKHRHAKLASGNSGTKFEYSLSTNEFKMNLSNLGYISIEILDAHDSTQPTGNYMLKMLERVLQKTIKRTYGKFESYIRDTLETEGRHFLDCELTRFTPTLIENAHADLTTAESSTTTTTTSLDDLARIISGEIARSQLAQVSLPDFEHQRSVLGSNALIEFTNGSLSGLDNVRLNGETKVKLQDEHLLVNASIGWANLRPHYNWTIYLGSSAIAQRRQDQQTNSTDTKNATTTTTTKPMARGFVAFTIKQVDFDALISRSLSSSSRLTVDSLEIRRLEGPKMDIGGLPGMNRVTRGVVNFFMSRLKQRLVGSIQPALKQELERVLNRLMAPTNHYH